MKSERVILEDCKGGGEEKCMVFFYILFYYSIWGKYGKLCKCPVTDAAYSVRRQKEREMQNGLYGFLIGLLVSVTW